MRKVFIEEDEAQVNKPPEGYGFDGWNWGGGDMGTGSKLLLVKLKKGTMQSAQEFDGLLRSGR